MNFNFSAIRSLAVYETKLVFRSWFFRILVLLSIFVIWYLQYLLQVNMDGSPQWPFKVYFFAVASLNLYLFTIIKSLLIIFLIRRWYENGKKRETLDTIYSRPISNVDIVTGKSLGLVFVFFVANLFSLSGAILLNLFTGSFLFPWYIYFFYLFALSLPALFFFLGFSAVVYSLLKQSFLTLILLVGFFFLSLFFLPDISHSLWDPRATDFPNIFSDFVGIVDLKVYLWQRFAFLLWGLGLLCIAILGMKRLTNRDENKWRLGGVAFFLIVLGCCLEYACGKVFSDKQSVRENYRSVFIKYQDVPAVDISEQQIVYEGKKEGMSVFSRLTVENRQATTIDRIVFYLNPFLKVTVLQEDGRDVPFSREEQCIVVNRSLQPGEVVSFHMNYEGNIDERLCYLDVKDIDYYQSPQYVGFARPGKHYAFGGENYTLLIPECLWYPVSVAPVNLTNPYAIRKSLSYFNLKVLLPLGKEAISQGERERTGDTVIFRNRHVMEGISLCIGNYDKRHILLDSVNMSLYLLKGHEGMLNVFDSVKNTFPDLLIEVKKHMEAVKGQIYPFDKLALVEVPVSFASYSRNWKNNDFTQPEILFFPELSRVKTSFSMSKKSQTSFLKESNYLFADETYIWKIDLYYLMRSLFQGEQYFGMDRVVNEQSLSPLFGDYSFYFSSDEYPIMDKIIKMFLHLFYYSRTMFSLMVAEDLQASNYLMTHSFKEALEDKQLPDVLVQKIIKSKMYHLINYVNLFISYEDFRSFLKDYCARSCFKEISLQDFVRELHNKYKVDISEFLADWYLKVESPKFLFKDIKIQTLDAGEQKKYMVSMNVYNPTKEEGVLSVLLHNSQPVKNFLIEGNSCYRIRMVAEKRPWVKAYTNTSGNIPNLIWFPEREISSVTSDSCSGIFKIDATEFAPATDEIIVDNIDPGCRVIQPKTGEWLRGFFDKNTKQGVKYYYSCGNMFFPSGWAEDFLPIGFFGNTVLSAYWKGAGKGNYKVEWEATIPDTGLYEVFIYNVRHPCRKEEDEQYYTVEHRDGVEQIKLVNKKSSLMWVSLGEYYFDSGKAKVVLDDRGRSAEQYIFADAVKWVRVT